ncbi:MAG TPA: PEP-CTERM sorting domain-containing protein [Bryobacteraceae bacterium]|nr:PEP-CTERM sorting domain-containing protein [Bryobacteraceae bacterium]
MKKKFSFASIAMILGLIGASQAGAITLNFANGVSDTSSSSIASCSSPYTGLTYYGCETTGFISDSVATASDDFMNPGTFGGGQGLSGEGLLSAFSGSGWTVVQDQTNALAGITLTVTNFSTGSYDSAGGIGLNANGHSISVSVGGLNSISADLASSLVWIQGLEINYLVGNNADFNTANNYNLPDDATFNGVTGCNAIPAGSPATFSPAPGGTVYCDPIYPFQYANHQFFDTPIGPWPNGSFRGIALLASIDTADNTITTYGGVSYGFDDFAAPEPGTWFLMLAGAAAVFFARRRFVVRG